MAMDFFEHQDAARRKTGRMVVLFILAVLVIMVLIYCVIAIAVLGFGAKAGVENAGSVLVNPALMLGVAVGTLAIIGLSSMYKVAQLRGGGSVVAESLSGRLLHRYTTDPMEQRVLNVVEEMAIASGTACPPVYLLDSEPGINAFAAGYSPGNAVIGITRGCAEQLSRDELQGVVAHEFSHILNGDMRLNIRLMGVLHGILVIGIIGYYVLRVAPYSGGSRRSSGKGGGNAMLAIMLIGAGLAVIGFAGTFFGNLIKAAVSRQREFLADASAVQFTRNPGGISGALRRIGGSATHASIRHPNAPQASHMFFGQAISLSMMLATHPPLPERIKRIDPSWDGTFLTGAAGVKTTRYRDKAAERDSLAERRQRQFERLRQRRSSAAALESIGKPSRAHVAHAAMMMGMLAGALDSTARTPYGARAVIFSLLIDRDPAVAQRQLSALQQSVHAEVLRLSQQMISQVQTLDVQLRLPLMDLALPALREMSRPQYEAFRRTVDALIAADRKIDLKEWIIKRIVVHHLDQHFGLAPGHGAARRTLNELRHPCAVLLSMLARVGSDDDDAARAAFAKAAAEVDLPADGMLGAESCTLRALDESLSALDRAKPLVKRQVIHACVACVLADEQVTPHETELLRAVCDSLGCPMPPLVEA